MKDVIKLLETQNTLIADHNKLFESSLGEFRRLLQLQAAEANVINARTALIDETLQKMLTGVSNLGINFEQLLEELKS